MEPRRQCIWYNTGCKPKSFTQAPAPDSRHRLYFYQHYIKSAKTLGIQSCYLGCLLYHHCLVGCCYSRAPYGSRFYIFSTAGLGRACTSRLYIQQNSFVPESGIGFQNKEHLSRIALICLKNNAHDPVCGAFFPIRQLYYFFHFIPQLVLLCRVIIRMARTTNTYSSFLSKRRIFRLILIRSFGNDIINNTPSVH